MADGIQLATEIVKWMEHATGRPLVSADRIPGGGTREGWFVDFENPDGTIEELFLRYSPGAVPDTSAFHPLAVEAEVVRALRSTAVPVPEIHAVHPDREAVLMERVAGDTWFYRIADPDEQVRVAQAFIASLAAQHRVDPRQLELSVLGPVRSAREHALERLAAIRRRAARPDGTVDPLLGITVDWLEANVPDYDGPVVLVQGDTGPGNFLYRDGTVTAVLDWELSHFGDPMDDIAWLSLRTVQDTFTHLPDRLREYEALSGHRLDESRVWYYRLFAEATMISLNAPHAAVAGGAATRDIGNALIYQQLHRRLWLEALNEAMGLGLRPPDAHVTPELLPWHGSYDDVLASLRTITTRIADPLAAQWTRGVARVVKLLQQADAIGRQFVATELDEIATATGSQFESLDEARAALDVALHAGAVSRSTYIELVWNRIHRDDQLAATASGALRERTWPPLQ